MLHVLRAIFYWLEVHTGTVNESGPYYGFFSGFGSDLGEITIIGGIIAWWRTHECHVDGCHRHGKHAFQEYKLCAKHHPSVPHRVSHLHIVKLHKDSLD